MKKFLVTLCLFSLILTLFGCGGKPRYAENYSVGAYGDGWSILYTDEDGVEEIAALGKTPQPLALEKGRLYFTDGGKLVSVDPDGNDRQETVIGTMNETGIITYVDGENFYCVEADNTRKCWRINKTNAADHAEIDIPRTFRPTDYAALLNQLRLITGALEDKIHLRSARAVLDSNGSLLSLDLEVLGFERRDGNSMNTWKTAGLHSTVSPDGSHTDYINENMILSLADKTVSRMMSLETFLTALETLDNALLPTTLAQGTAEIFCVTYQVKEYESALTDQLPRVSATGETVDADQAAFHLVLAQVGGCDTAFTDSEGCACGNLTVVQVG